MYKRNDVEKDAPQRVGNWQGVKSAGMNGAHSSGKAFQGSVWQTAKVKDFAYIFAHHTTHGCTNTE